MSGFIKIYRTFFDHWTWAKKREYSEAEAWLDLVQSAQWQPTKQMVKGQLFDVDRGQLLASDRYLQERWQWKSLTRVQTFLKTVSDDGMLRSEYLGKTSRRTICNYSLYNTSEVSEKSEKGQPEVRNQVSERSVKGQPEVKYKKEEIKKEEIKKESLAQAGGFDFEKLARKVGRTCATLITQGEVGAKLPAAKKPLLLKWLGYRHEKGKAITTTIELHEVLKTWLEKDANELSAAISKSVAAGWTTLVFDQKTADTAPLPDHWKPGIEATLKMTPETTLKYYQHLISLGWYKTTEQGQPYWNRPEKNNERRTGETTIKAAAQN